MTDPAMATVLAPPRPDLASRGSAPPDAHARLRQVAADLESEFLAEMLKSAGVGAPRDAFGGGAGEDQFSSFLVRAQADEIVKAGGLGLAQALFESLLARDPGADGPGDAAG